MFMFVTSQVRPIEMKALQSYNEYGKLCMEPGDMITVIDGKPDHYYWKGQNKRTCDVSKIRPEDVGSAGACSCCGTKYFSGSSGI